MAQPENKGVEIVDQEHFAPGDLTVAAQVARLKAAQPQVLIAWVIGTPFVTALRGLSDAGFNAPVLASNSNMIYDQMKTWEPILPAQIYFSGPAFLGGYIPRPQLGPVREFLSVTKDVGVVPDFSLSLGWDPAGDRDRGIPRARHRRQRRTISTATSRRLHNYPGIMGMYDFTTGDQRGLTQRDLTILRWDAKKSAWFAASRPGGEPM